VITSGGIGPTHDDVTFEGVARAFGEQVIPHPELVALCKEFFGTDDLKSPKLKLAFIPESSALCYGIDTTTGFQGKYPVVRIRNVYIFPGVPKLLRTAFERLEGMFRNAEAAFHTCEIYISVDEASIAGILNEANDLFKDRVTMGSYPDFYSNYYKVKLTLESMQKSDVDEMRALLFKNLPAGAIVDFNKDPISQAAERVYALCDCDDEEFAKKIRRSIDIVEECLSRYGLQEVCIGFNGGKDCTALLHLVHAVMLKRRKAAIGVQNGVTPMGVQNGVPAISVQNGVTHSSSKNNISSQLSALNIRNGQPFPEVELFISICNDSYRLNLISVTGRIKDALNDLRSTHPLLKAVLMGTRRSDPHSFVLKDFSPTDPGWPEYMRVNPLLDWTYSDLWSFIRRLSLPYCSLYDRGYTSLGSMENTHPNPELRVMSDRGIVSYRSAYLLTTSQNERAGRN